MLTYILPKRSSMDYSICMFNLILQSAIEIILPQITIPQIVRKKVFVENNKKIEKIVDNLMKKVIIR